MSDFKVGDKIVRKKEWIDPVYSDDGYDGRVLTVTAHNGFSVFFSFEGGRGKSSGDAYKFELYEEKQMFDMNTMPWYIIADTPEERVAAQKWVFEQGIYWSVSGAEVKDWDFKYLTNCTTEGVISKYLMHSSTTLCSKAKQIKLTFKIETTITNVEYPEVLSEKEIETRKIREEMEKLAERLKKLESE